MADVARLVTAIDAKRAALGRTVAVGISGVDCSGKSTLAADLVSRFDGSQALVVAGDEFTRPTAERYADPDEARSYYRSSFDYSELFERLLPAIAAGSSGPFELRVTDWERDEWQPATLVVPSSGVVIVEGCFLFADGGQAAFDLTVWLDLPLDRVVARALRRPRDLARMGGPEGVTARYQRRYVPGQRLHLETDAPAEHADIVLRA